MLVESGPVDHSYPGWESSLCLLSIACILACTIRQDSHVYTLSPEVTIKEVSHMSEGID